jgi:hypothetical protein
MSAQRQRVFSGVTPIAGGLNPGRNQARLACIFQGLESSTQSSRFLLFSDQRIFYLLPYRGIEQEEIVSCIDALFDAAGLAAALTAAPVCTSVQPELLS